MPHLRRNTTKSFYHTKNTANFTYATISTLDFLWIPLDSSDSDLKDYWKSERDQHNLRILSPPAFQNRRPTSNENHSFHWILTNANHSPLSWACAQLFPSPFKVISLYLGHMSGNLDEASFALDLLSSSIFIEQSTDVIKIIPLSLDWQKHCEGMPYHEVKQAFSFYNDINSCFDGKVQSGSILNAYYLDKFKWWESKKGEAAQKTLNYLSLRKQRKKPAS